MPIPKKTKSVSPYFPEEDADQIRAALNAVGHLKGYTSITELVEAATLRELRRLQRKYNGARNGRHSGRTGPTRHPRGNSKPQHKAGRTREFETQ